ncbi:MAG: hypothetical protein AB9835_02140 [Eubacteriales bacterium]
MKREIINMLNELNTDKATEFDKGNKQKADRIISQLQAELKTTHKNDVVNTPYLKGYKFKVIAHQGRPFTLHIMPGSDTYQNLIDSFDYDKNIFPANEYIDYGVTKIRTIDFDSVFYGAVTALNKSMLPIYYAYDSLSEIYEELVFDNQHMGLSNSNIDIYIDLPQQLKMEFLSPEVIANIGNNIKLYLQEKADVTITDVKPIVVKNDKSKLDMLKQENLMKIINMELGGKERLI